MNNEVEIWKDIPNYEGLYQCSNFGRIKSLPKIMGYGYSKLKLKIPTLNNKGYYYCNLWKNNTSKTFLLHQIVAITFLEHVASKMKVVVDHIDNDKTNNRVSNLQLITQRQNVSKDRTNKHSIYTGVRFIYNKWSAQIKINNKTQYLGYFNTETEAHQAYQNKIKSI
jgi:NUMOD4 motif/HNH endonuclease